MNKYADLHIHSSYSDGVLPPDKIMQKARLRNLKAISITDHDTLNGSLEALKLSDYYGIEVVPGIEFSCDFEGHDIHVLGYFSDEDLSQLEKVLIHLRQKRVDRAYKIGEKFKEIGIDISVDKIVKENESIGRPHFARELIRQRFVDNFEEAFTKYLIPGKPCYVPKEKLTVYECIRIIHSLSGAAILAHPGLIKDEKVIERLVDEDFDGFEVYHPKHTQKDKLKYYGICKDRSLLITGGSDFHQGDSLKKSQIGSEKLSYSYVEEIHNFFLKVKYNTINPEGK
jgi:predicted metal-dependent phosphoesterase TrpH